MGIRADETKRVLRYLRRFEELPTHADKIFVVDEDEILPVCYRSNVLLVNDPEALVEDVMARDVVTFRPDEDCGETLKR